MIEYHALIPVICDNKRPPLPNHKHNLEKQGPDLLLSFRSLVSYTSSIKRLIFCERLMSSSRGRMDLKRILMTIFRLYESFNILSLRVGFANFVLKNCMRNVHLLCGKSKTIVMNLEPEEIWSVAIPVFWISQIVGHFIQINRYKNTTIV